MANLINFHMVRFPSYEYSKDCNRDYVVFCNERKERKGRGGKSEYHKTLPKGNAFFKFL